MTTIRLLALWLLMVGVVFGQLQCNTYSANGSVSLTFALTYPGDPTCLPGAWTNTLLWHGSSIGQASCPTTFNQTTNSWYQSLTYFSDSYPSPGGSLSGAGCVDGKGPGTTRTAAELLLHRPL